MSFGDVIDFLCVGIVSARASLPCAGRIAPSLARHRVAVPPMVLVTEVEHPKSMDFRNQRRVYLLRKVDGLPWLQIRSLVRNLQGQPPSERQCREVFKGFSIRQGRRLYRYSRCGRKPWKLSKEVEQFLVRRVGELRKVNICTSRTLQVVLASELSVQLECSTTRKALARNGYR